MAELDPNNRPKGSRMPDVRGAPAEMPRSDAGSDGPEGMRKSQGGFTQADLRRGYAKGYGGA